MMKMWIRPFKPCTTLVRQWPRTIAINGLLQEPATVTGVEGLEDWAVRLRIMVKTLAQCPMGGCSVILRRQIRITFARARAGACLPPSGHHDCWRAQKDGVTFLEPQRAQRF